MIVGQSPIGISLSENIYLDKYSDKVLVLGNNKKNYKHFILPNISNKNNRFILLDSINHFECLNNTIICNFNTPQISYNPFKLIENDTDIGILTNYFLSCFKFKTKIDPTKLTKGLFDYLYSVISYVYYYDKDNLNIKNINNILKKANESIENLDLMINEMFQKEMITKIMFKKYFNFKILPLKLQKEITNQISILFEEITKQNYFKENNNKIINLTEFLKDNQNLVIIPNTDNKKIVKLDELLIIQILSKQKESDNKLLQYNLLSKTKLRDLIPNGTLFDSFQNINNISNFQVMINKPNINKNLFLTKILFYNYSTVSITFIENNIENFNKNIKHLDNAMLLINNIVYYGTDDTKTITILNAMAPELENKDFSKKEFNNKVLIFQLYGQNTEKNIIYDYILDIPIQSKEKEENIKEIEFKRNFKNTQIKNNKNVETWGLPNNYL